MQCYKANILHQSCSFNSDCILKCLESTSARKQNPRKVRLSSQGQRIGSYGQEKVACFPVPDLASWTELEIHKWK